MTATNVIHIAGALEPPDLADEIEAAIPTTGSAMWGPMSSSFGLYSLDLLPLDGTTATYHRVVTDQPWTHGQGGGNPIPAVCALVQLDTGVRGRSNRGRIYIPAVGESVFSSGLLDAAPREDCETGWEEFRTNLITAGVALVVASYRNRDAHPVIAVSVPQKCATQRRRQSRIG
jgi:hypothetical protein